MARPRKRLYKTSDQVKKEKELKHEWNELLQRHNKQPKFYSGNSKATLPSQPSKIPSYSSIPSRNENVKIVRSVHMASVTGPSIVKQRYTGSMAERESKALEEIERKKKRVGIAYNKGAYQYITDETDPKDIGRK
jgi:hypothetical protein